MTDALYREIRRKMDSGEERFSVVISEGDDDTLMDVNHMVLDDGMLWTYDNSQPTDAGPGMRRLSFIRQYLVRDDEDDE